jgi:hypothetical protein
MWHNGPVTACFSGYQLLTSQADDMVPAAARACAATTDTRDTEAGARRPRPVLRLVRGFGWLVFFLVVAAVSYILLVLVGH